MGLNPTDGPNFVSIYIDDVLALPQSLADHKAPGVGDHLSHPSWPEVKTLFYPLGGGVPGAWHNPSRDVDKCPSCGICVQLQYSDQRDESEAVLGLASYYWTFIPSFASPQAEAQ